jgi:sulfite exporter TauE/SafE
VGFGLAYAAVPLWKSPAKHILGDHAHSDTHTHLPLDDADLVALPVSRLMPALFVVFALGPCEALLPLLVAGGITLALWQSALVAVVFSVSTVCTMLSLVGLFYLGASKVRLPWFGRLQMLTHVLSGLTLAMSGAAIQLLGI